MKTGDQILVIRKNIDVSFPKEAISVKHCSSFSKPILSCELLQKKYGIGI